MYVFIMIVTGILSFIWLFLNRNLWLSFPMTAALFIVFIFLHGNYLSGWIDWFLFYILLFWILSVTRAPRRMKPAVDKDGGKTRTIHTHEGDLTGVFSEDHAIEIYAGVPYAKPPVGSLRWKEPQNPESYAGIRQCDRFAPMAMQKQNSMFINSLISIFLYKNWYPILHERVRYPMSEDCLYLNIWKPAGDHEKLPVFFYIHGGSLTNGQSWWENYRGDSFARQNVIFITISYRLGAFGFFADEHLRNESEHHTTGMYGVLDQLKALEWVKANISAFGGNPDNITIAGESAGSSCVNALCTSPLAKGLFKNAIGESSSISAKHPAHSLVSLEDAEKQAEELKSAFHTEDIAGLRKIPASAIVKAKISANIICSLCTDGYVLTETPYESSKRHIHNETALLNGYNLHDGDYFALAAGKVNLKNYRQKVKQLYKDQTDTILTYHMPHTDKEAASLYKQLLTQYLFAYGHITWSRLAIEDEPVYTYIFAKENRRTRSNHTGELPYAYGNLNTFRQKYEKSDYALSRIMQKYWINFIYSGSPNNPGLPQWDTFDRGIMKLNENTEMIPVPLNDVNQCIDRLQDES